MKNLIGVNIQPTSRQTDGSVQHNTGTGIENVPSLVDSLTRTLSYLLQAVCLSAWLAACCLSFAEQSLVNSAI